jgi:hypothetical protein
MGSVVGEGRDWQVDVDGASEVGKLQAGTIAPVAAAVALKLDAAGRRRLHQPPPAAPASRAPHAMRKARREAFSLVYHQHRGLGDDLLPSFPEHDMLPSPSNPASAP